MCMHVDDFGVCTTDSGQEVLLTSTPQCVHSVNLLFRDQIDKHSLKILHSCEDDCISIELVLRKPIQDLYATDRSAIAEFG